MYRVLEKGADWEKYCEANPATLLGEHWRRRGPEGIAPAEWLALQNHGELRRAAAVGPKRADWAAYCALNPVVGLFPALRPSLFEVFPPVPLPETPRWDRGWRVLVEGAGAPEAVAAVRADRGRRRATTAGPRPETMISHQTATGHHTLEATDASGRTRRFHYDYSAESLFGAYFAVGEPGSLLATIAQRREARRAAGRDFLDDRVMAVQRLTRLVSETRLWVFVLCGNEPSLGRAARLEAFYSQPGLPFRTSFLATAGMSPDEIKVRIVRRVCANRT